MANTEQPPLSSDSETQKIKRAYIKNWYKAYTSEYGDGMIILPNSEEEGLGPEKLYGEVIDTNILELKSNQIFNSIANYQSIIIEGKTEKNNNLLKSLKSANNDNKITLNFGQEISYDINLGSNILSSLPGGIKDLIIIDSSGFIRLIKYTDIITINGEEGYNWRIDNSSITGSKIFYSTEAEVLNDLPSNFENINPKPLLCNQFELTTITEQVFGFDVTVFMYCIGIIIPDSFGISTSADFNSWLQNNSLTIIYPLVAEMPTSPSWNQWDPTLESWTITYPTSSEYPTITNGNFNSNEINIIVKNNINNNIIYSNQTKDFGIELYSYGEWNDNTTPLEGTTSAHIMDFKHSGIRRLYFPVPSGTTISKINTTYSKSND